MAYTQQEQNIVDELTHWWRWNGWNPMTLQKKNLNQLLALRAKMNNDKSYWDMKNKPKQPVQQPVEQIVKQDPQPEQLSLFANKRLVKKEMIMQSRLRKVIAARQKKDKVNADIKSIVTQIAKQYYNSSDSEWVIKFDDNTKEELKNKGYDENTVETANEYKEKLVKPYYESPKPQDFWSYQDYMESEAVKLVSELETFQEGQYDSEEYENKTNEINQLLQSYCWTDVQITDPKSCKQAIDAVKKQSVDNFEGSGAYGDYISQKIALELGI